MHRQSRILELVLEASKQPDLSISVNTSRQASTNEDFIELDHVRVVAENLDGP